MWLLSRQVLVSAVESVQANTLCRRVRWELHAVMKFHPYASDGHW